MALATALQSYNQTERAQAYHAAKGFDPQRKEQMLDVTLRLLLDMAPPGSLLLELGAGTGLFTQKILNAGHFAKVYVTDGAAAMLTIAQQQLTENRTQLNFELLDFSAPTWSQRYTGKQFGAVTSSMAIHHITDKARLFGEVLQLLAPGGFFVFADHLAGATSVIDNVIGRERGRIKLTAQGKDPTDSAEMAAFLQIDQAKQVAEGNQCESLARYLAQLTQAGFEHADCLWRDYWLAVFVARKSVQ